MVPAKTILVSIFALALLPVGCATSRAPVERTIEFTKVPPFAEGSSERTEAIEGRAQGVRRGEKVVLYARSGAWWIQPTTRAPFTSVETDSTWKNRTHPGSAYAALLVNEAYYPSPKIDTLPGKGGGVLATAIVENNSSLHPTGNVLLFSGYEWMIRQNPSNPGGTHNDYDLANAWTDTHGSLHMRIAGQPRHWTSAEVNLTRSLGYGSYRFVVRDLSQLEPAMVFTMLTWDDDGPAREMNIEISKWGASEASRNAQFVIQPYHVPANTAQFQAPPGMITFMLRWAPGRASFKAFRGAVTRWESPSIGEHVFTSGVPAPGNEAIHMNLYIFGDTRSPVQRGTEVVVEQFEYLP